MIKLAPYFFTFFVFLLFNNTYANAADNHKIAEDSLDCASPSDKNIQFTSIQAFMHSATQVSVAKASVAKGVLSDPNRQKLIAASSVEQVQQFILEQFVHLEQGSHKYSFSGPGGCALTKSYGNHHESICLQPGAAQLGLETSYLPDTISSKELRKAATEWSLNLSCKGKNCAVDVDQRQFELQDSFLLIAKFNDEQAAISIVEGLNILAKMCSSPRK